MIVKMKHLDLVCVAADTEATLEKLRALGAVHLDLSKANGQEVADAKGDAADAERAVRVIRKARESKDYADALQLLPCKTGEIIALAERRDALAAKADEIGKTIKKYAPYGDFDPALAAKLAASGVFLHLKKDGSYLISCNENDVPADERVELPAQSLGAMRKEYDAANAEILQIDSHLAASDEDSIIEQYPALADKIAFSAARELISRTGEVACVSGWIAAPSVGKLADAAHENGWGTLVRDPAPDEIPPTLIEPPRIFRPVKALFDGLGIAPAYNEADVSVPFMCYFSIFFAMLVGDGGYGSLIFAMTLFGWKKYRAARAAAKSAKTEVMRSWLVLLTVFSLATIAWGFLSNTWFGAAIPAFKEWPTVKWLADPSYQHMMLLCFTIGASHLILARIWTGISIINDITCLSQFGWAGILLFMYVMTNAIIGIFDGVPTWAYVVFGVSLVLVFGFTLKKGEFKTRGIEVGMLPLNIMSALGDIISYVRLFAVGLASVKVAENFNGMALDIFNASGSLWLKPLLAAGMVFVLLVGHGLNFAMAGLSILVHAVRLNTLEFSNHKGVSWAGYAFKPFKKH